MGKQPFETRTTMEMLRAILTEAPRLPDVAPPLRATLARALEKDPGKRFSSLAELQTVLAT
jgi:hypothetical protein